jgi:3-methyladenine DNA glycosylase AlkD
MSIILENIKSELLKLDKERVGTNRLLTPDVRKLSADYFKRLDDKSMYNLLSICEELLNENKWELKLIAFDWAYRVRKEYTKETYFTFYNWLKKYVRDWGDCDDFCTHAFGILILKYKELFTKVLEWTKDEDFWVRRAASVVLIPSLMRNNYNGLDPFEISNRLMNDEHYLVLKGYGWMLKVFTKVNKDEVIEYLIKNHKNMPRLSFRYAIENLDKQTRSKLMRL